MATLRNRPVVLLVEDDPEIADQVQSMLEPTYNVECTQNVAHAFVSFRQQSPDVMVVDCHVAGDDVDKLTVAADKAGSGVVLICRNPELLSHLHAFFQCPSLSKPFKQVEVRSAIECAMRNRKLPRPAPDQVNNAALEI